MKDYKHYVFDLDMFYHKRLKCWVFDFGDGRVEFTTSRNMGSFIKKLKVLYEELVQLYTIDNSRNRSLLDIYGEELNNSK